MSEEGYNGWENYPTWWPDLDLAQARLGQEVRP